MAGKTWDEATAAAAHGLPAQGARERRRHARNFAAWCAERGMDPLSAERRSFDAYLLSLPTGDPQRRAKVRCALRAVLREADPDHAARVAGLGNQMDLLKNLPNGLGVLVEEIVERQPKRTRVVASALTRLFAWCREVDADPLAVTATDLPQFRCWLIEVGTTNPETMVVATDFVELRCSPLGRQLLGEVSLPRDLLINLSAPADTARATT